MGSRNGNSWPQIIEKYRENKCGSHRTANAITIVRDETVSTIEMRPIINFVSVFGKIMNVMPQKTTVVTNVRTFKEVQKIECFA